MPIASAFRFALRLLGLAVIVQVSLAGALHAAGAADGFNPNVQNGTVYAVAVQPDGKILLAGKFDNIMPNGSGVAAGQANLVRVNADGTNDASFKPSVDGQINALALQADGQIVIGGKFTGHAARLKNDGSVDGSFSPKTAGSNSGAPVETPEVTAIAIQSDGKILIGGGFATVQPGAATSTTARAGLARFNPDGTLDTTFADPKIDGVVLAMALQSDGAIVIGGGFTHVGGTTDTYKLNHVARVSSTGVVDTSFNPNANGSISSIAIQLDGRIVIGGAFLSLQPNGSEIVDSSHSRLARLEKTGVVDTSFAPIPDGTVNVVKIQPDGRILVGGVFASSSAGMGAYAGRLLPDGELDITFYPNTNYAVNAFAVQADGSVILGGAFTTLSGRGASAVVRGRAARVSPHGGLDTDFRPDVNGRLQGVAKATDDTGRVYVAGSFTSVAGATHNSLVRLSATGVVDATFKPSANGAISVVVPLAGGKIMIGGSFTTVNDVGRRYIARLNADGSLDNSFSVQPNSNVTAILPQGDKFIIAGNFTTVAPYDMPEPVTRVSLARVTSDGSLDLTFTAQAYQSISSLILQSDGKFIASGTFTSVLSSGTTSQVSRFHLARFTADGVLDTTFTPGIDGVALSGLVQADGQIVLVGTFTQVAGTAATSAETHKYIVRLKSDGKIDSAFKPNASDVVTTVQLLGSDYLIGGFFTEIEQPAGSVFVQRNYFAKLLTADGKVDEAFDLGLDRQPGNTVLAIVPSATSGKYLVGGAFTTLKNGTIARNRLAQISVDSGGALAVDSAFNTDFGSSQGAAIETLTQQSDGSVVVGGQFATLGGTNSTNLALFNFDGAPDASFYPNIQGKVHSVAQLPLKGESVTTQRNGFAWLEANGELRTGIAKGSDPSAFAGVRAIAVQPDGKVLVSASVTRPATDTNTSGTADYLLRFNADGSVDTAFEPLVNGTVLVIKPQADGKILIGGSFGTVGTSSSSSRNNMARLNADGSVDTAFNPNFGAGVTAIEIDADGKILVGGSFTTLAPNGATTSTVRNYIVRLNPADATVDTTFNPSADSTVRAITVLPDKKILIGGLFTTLQPGATGTTYTRKYLARLNADGTVDSVDFNVNAPVAQLVPQANGQILVGGTFTQIRGETRNYLARLNPETADLTLDAFKPNPSGEITAISVQTDGKILIAGNFTALQPNYDTYDFSTATPRRYAARLNTNGTIDASFNPAFNDAVSYIAAYPDGSVLAGGTFTSIQPTGSVLVGGEFARISGVDVSNLALFSFDGSVSSTFLPNPNGAIYATQIFADGHFVVGGAFTTIGGKTRNRIARFTAANALDETFNPNADDDVHAFALQSDGKLLVGGKFKNIGGTGHAYLARINTDGSVDSGFNASVTGDVTAILVQGDQKIIVLSAGSGPLNIVGRLNADGSADSSFTAVNGGSAAISAIALQTNGKIVVGGAFTTIASTAKSYLARLNADGSIDTSLTATPSGPVTSLMISADGKIMFGGAFNAVDSLPRFGLARIVPSTPAASSFSVNPERTSVTWSRSGSSPEISGAVFQGSTDGVTWTTLGYARRIDGTPNWQLTGLSNLDVGKPYFLRAFGVIPGSSQGSSGLTESRGAVYLSALPVITSATAVNGVNGSAFSYSISSTDSSATYSTSALPAGLTFSGKGISGTPTQTGTFTITLTATNAAGSTSTTLTLIVAASGGSSDPGSRLINLAVLSQVSSSNVIISGFVLTGNGSQNVLIRVVGPTLGTTTPKLVDNPLAKPHLKLFNAKGGVITEVGAWSDSAVTTEAARLGATPPLPTGSADVAFLITLPAGVYTFHVTDAGTSGGYALAEIYDAASSTPTLAEPRLANLSARGIANGTSLVTGGFVVTGSTPKKVLVRGVGPGLFEQGVTAAITNPRIELWRSVNGVNTKIASNDDWETQATLDAAYPAATAAEISAAATKTGAFAFRAGSKDAAMLLTLPPGVYSAQVAGSGTATGEAMVEIYDDELPTLP